MELKFRTLNANEIEARVGQASEKGLSLLLYKDARVDMTLLDETVGPMNWQRYHSRENANCTVAIFDIEKMTWVTKEDTGTESNTEAEKGLASDSFKRACVNWGIGRELYTAPFIWINAADCELKPKRNGNGYECRDKFVVSNIEYNDRREICGLSIKNAKTGKVVYTMGKASAAPKKTAQKVDYSAGAFVPKCADCDEDISISEHDFSAKKYGRPLCRDCQKAVGSSEAEPKPTPKPAPAVHICAKCGDEVKSYVSVKTGKEVSAEQHAAITFARYKSVMCQRCATEHEKKLKTLEDYSKKLSEAE